MTSAGNIPSGNNMERIQFDPGKIEYKPAIDRNPSGSVFPEPIPLAPPSECIDVILLPDRIEMAPNSPITKTPISIIKKEPSEEENRIQEKLDEIRTEEYGPKFEDLSKADRKEIDKEIEKMKEDGTYGDEDNIVKDPNNPGVEYQQVGDFVEAKVTLYEGLTFDELPEEDQEAVLDYEKNKEDIMNSSLSDTEKEAAIAALDKPDCMDEISYEYRYTEGNLDSGENNVEGETENNEKVEKEKADDRQKE